MLFAVCLQFLACLAQLPPPMNTTDILWLSCFSCPLLRYTHRSTNALKLYCGAEAGVKRVVYLGCVDSVSLLGKPPDSSVMTVATGKNLDAIPRKVGSVTSLKLTADI